MKYVHKSTNDNDSSFQQEKDKLVEEVEVTPMVCVDIAHNEALTEDKDGNQSPSNPDGCPIYWDTGSQVWWRWDRGD